MTLWPWCCWSSERFPTSTAPCDYKPDADDDGDSENYCEDTHTVSFSVDEVCAEELMVLMAVAKH